jgi:hypothetical protein
MITDIPIGDVRGFGVTALHNTIELEPYGVAWILPSASHEE